MRAQKKYAERHNAGRRPCNFEIGDVCLLQNSHQKRGTSAKLAPLFRGPVTVLESFPNNVYKIEGKRRGRTFTNTVNVEKMRPFFPRPKSAPIRSRPSSRSQPPSQSSSPMPNLCPVDLPVAMDPLDSIPSGRPWSSGGWQPDVNATSFDPNQTGRYRLRSRS